MVTSHEREEEEEEAPSTQLYTERYQHADQNANQTSRGPITIDDWDEDLARSGIRPRPLFLKSPSHHNSQDQSPTAYTSFLASQAGTNDNNRAHGLSFNLSPSSTSQEASPGPTDSILQKRNISVLEQSSSGTQSPPHKIQRQDLPASEQEVKYKTTPSFFHVVLQSFNLSTHFALPGTQCYCRS